MTPFRWPLSLIALSAVLLAHRLAAAPAPGADRPPAGVVSGAQEEPIYYQGYPWLAIRSPDRAAPLRVLTTDRTRFVPAVPAWEVLSARVTYEVRGGRREATLVEVTRVGERRVPPPRVLVPAGRGRGPVLDLGTMPPPEFGRDRHGNEDEGK